MTDRTTERVPERGDEPDTKQEVARLESEVAELRQLLAEHLEVCPAAVAS